ncbi:hypothetical protein NJ76_32150, partial [Rhodococcus sp. IITR03]
MVACSWAIGSSSSGTAADHTVDEGCRVVEIRRVRQQVGVRPHVVAGLGAGVGGETSHSAAASRTFRGRSSRPTSVAKVCSAGPPVARRRRRVS